MKKKLNYFIKSCDDKILFWITTLSTSNPTMAKMLQKFYRFFRGSQLTGEKLYKNILNRNIAYTIGLILCFYYPKYAKNISLEFVIAFYLCVFLFALYITKKSIKLFRYKLHYKIFSLINMVFSIIIMCASIGAFVHLFVLK